MKNSLLFNLIVILLFQCEISEGIAQISTDQLLENTYYLYDAQRQGNGMYRDSKIINGTDYHPISIANTGVGLISLCIADRAGYITYARDLARQTLRAALGYEGNFNPDRNSKGFYRHFLNIETGENAWNSEYSTIDTALLATGALFAKKYFNDPEISAYADEIFLSVDWKAAIRNASTGAIWRELDGNGNGQGGSALPFNEYMIVAYLAKEAEDNSGGVGTTAWNVWTQLDNFANANYWGYPLLADYDNISAFQSDFTVQFPYYLTPWAHNSPLYRSYMGNMADADKFYYQQISGEYPNLNTYEWGLGAGNSPANYNGVQYTPYGYNADHINNHPARVVSPHIVAGYIPIRASAKNNLQQMLNGSKGIYNLDNGTQLLWRYSLDEVNWDSDQIQGIDYSSMLYGLAADKFGASFFADNNNYNFPNNSSGILSGIYNLKNKWAGYYATSDNIEQALVRVTSKRDWSSQDWELQHVSGNEYRLKEQYGNRYLRATNSNGGVVEVRYLRNNWNSQKWILEKIGSYYKLRNKWTGRYLRGSNQDFGNVTTHDDRNWGSLQWQLERSFERSSATIPTVVTINDKMSTYDKVSTEDVEPDNNLTLYPNPVSDVLQIQTTIGTEISYRIINTTGQIVSTGTTLRDVSVDQLKAGMYFIEVNNKGHKLIERFIKK